MKSLRYLGIKNICLNTNSKENKLAKQYFFDVEIRNTSNEILSKGIIPAVGEDNYESHDALYPFNNGKGFVIMSEYPDKVTVYSADKNEFSISGTILNQNKALAGFIMTDDASDIVCLFYDENTYKSYLENYKLSNGQLIKKWEKRPSGKHAQFSNFNGLYHNSGNFKLINILTFSEEQADGLEVYTLDGDLILKKYLTNCSEFESYMEGSNCTYVGNEGEHLQYFDKNNVLQKIDLKKIFGMDTTLNARFDKFINTKSHIICEFSVRPHYSHKEYMTGLFSGIGILPKSDLSKGKYYPIYKNSALVPMIKSDTLYLLKGYGSLYPDLIQKIKLPLPYKPKQD
ncbi:MAG: hypothetical protein IPN89_03815 [Saprospiraceae bacterium]|nr:hypothetical protein [Saprospiraceae bacterium]